MHTHTYTQRWYKHICEMYVVMSLSLYFNFVLDNRNIISALQITYKSLYLRFGRQD